MIMPDVKVLLSAFSADHPHHPLCHGWLHNMLKSGERFGLSSLVLAAMVRLSTNPRVFPVPSSLAEAFRFCDYLFAFDQAAAVNAGPRHWSIFANLCQSLDIKGKAVTDVWYAALAIENGCEWVTLDRDFRRFPDLKWRTP